MADRRGQSLPCQHVLSILGIAGILALTLTIDGQEKRSAAALEKAYQESIATE